MRLISCRLKGLCSPTWRGLLRTPSKWTEMGLVFVFGVIGGSVKNPDDSIHVVDDE